VSIVAVIDIGSNSTNLLVTGADGEPLRWRGSSTRLGAGLATTGRLGAEGIAHTVDAVTAHLDIARELGASRTVVVGTAACRRAANTDDLVTAISERTGHTLEILSENDEARLAFAGAVAGLGPVEVPTLVVDIGGGSTELAVGVREAELAVSIPFGAVTSTESHFTSDPPRPEDLTNLIGEVGDEIDDLVRAHPSLGAVGRVIGVAGTIVTMAKVEVGTNDPSPLHGMLLTRDAAEDVFRTLATEKPADRVLNPGLPSDRGDIIVAGCCILVALMRRLGLDGITVSTRGLLFGVAARERLGT
jgi:exopolyphosphatase/guanosine-5'-triphosphate,3'-diphosphate pyrophosphatase